MQETKELNGSKARYDKGMELYKQGKVVISKNGLLKVSGYYEADTEKMTCNCPDYKTRKQTCKHLFAAMLFIKNRGKQGIEHLNGFTNGSNGNSIKPVAELKHTPNKPQEVYSKDFDKQATITRLAVINSAIELLKTHRRPIQLPEILSLASQLEQWALDS